MPAAKLTKSYINTHDPKHPVRDDVVVYDLFEKARKKGLVGEILNLETGKRRTTIQILDKCEKYAKGLLALGLVPGEDDMVVLGCPTLEAACLYAAAAAVGIGYGHPFVYAPRNKCITDHLSFLTPRLVVCGEGSGGLTCTALLDMFDEDSDELSSNELPYVEHLFYDDTYKNRSPAHKWFKSLDKLSQIGESVTDEQLKEAKKNVKPDFNLSYLFTSGSTGKPKCAVHSHRGLVNESLMVRVRLGSIMALNVNLDTMGGYAGVGQLLAGGIRKVVMITELYEERTWADVAKIHAEALIKEKIEHIGLTITSLRLIANYCENNNLTLSRFKSIAYGAQLISRKYKEENLQRFGGIQYTAYGMTEVLSIGWTSMAKTAAAQEARMESRIYPKPNAEVRLTDKNNKIVDIGQDGEIQIKVYSCLKEYRNDEVKTRELFTDDGYLKTGDMAVMYPDGTFVIKGRLVECISFKVLGKVEYPGPIEEIVARYPGVADVSVVAGQHLDWMGDELTYCIRMKQDSTPPTEQELLEFCRLHMLTDKQRPARIVYFDELPTVPNGRKVSKAILRQKVLAMVEEDQELGKCQWFKDLEKNVSAK